MCGIAGIVGGRQAERAVMARMLDALRHRGPDDEAIHVGRGATLGHRRLSIIDLEGGRQPIGNEDGTRWIVCNGEIYNYRPLMAELEAKGHRFSTRSDTEVVLHLYEEMGETCVERLRGMYAFAIWDEVEGKLFAARDHLGQKPLFYRLNGGELAFASEIKALLTLLPGAPEPDLRALRQYLALRIIAPPLTMFEGIAKLPPAHCLSYSPARGLRIWRYWDLAYEPKLRGNEEELLAALEQELIESVRLHLVSDVPVGAFLSGGLDSTLVLALARTRAASGRMPTFTIGLPYGAFDEAPYARLVAERYGTEHHEQVMIPSLVQHLPDLIDCLDEPSDPLSVCSYLISRMASRHVKVVIGGDGGDELFGGYDRYYGNLYAGYYAVLPSALRRRVVGPLLRLVPDGAWYKSRVHQVKWLHQASFLSGGERYARTLGYFYFTPELMQRIAGPALVTDAAGFDPYAAIADAYAQAPAEHPVDRMLYADSRIRLPDHPVMILDRTSMAHGLEARAPFMDHEVAAFAARLPTELKVRWRTLRYAQQRLCQHYLPSEILARKKQGFSSALPYLLAEEYRLLERALLYDSLLVRDGILAGSGIQELLIQQAIGRADHGNRLWLLLNAEAWYRMKILGQSREELAAAIARHKAAPSPRAA
ncbi:asparagine synthase (glutamine-hydrolyzing) [Benzoatithermus flavus]|uniref:asparagine synthase (glutamine-hydrolyzing) n=1 Tax=Benzoatithermus flavus TaxID=3108223 RepID=A0ABU8XV08_9PROT